VSVGLVQFKQTGQPRGVADPLLNQRASTQQLRAGRKRQQADDVPYSDAPPLKGSNFEALKKLGVLDANTHKFAEAWKAGYAGEGTTVGVLDGGADFGHPDLIGTWKTCTNAEAFGGDPGWNGWPKAFDPSGRCRSCWRRARSPPPRSRRARTAGRACAPPPSGARRGRRQPDWSARERR